MNEVTITPEMIAAGLRALGSAGDVSRESLVVFIYTAMAMNGPPSAIYRPDLFMEGGKWVAAYGDNIQNGLRGYGETPADALADFDRLCVERGRFAVDANGKPVF
jgi:hypothetical protein